MRSPDRDKLKVALQGTALEEFEFELFSLLDEKYANPKHGHFEDWKKTFISLPDLTTNTTDFNQNTIQLGCADEISLSEKKDLETRLIKLSPWRKGPFNIFGIHIDTEWRSDWKWSRIAPHINLRNKLILDVGCGNGYYALRMQGAGAKLVIGVEPSWHYVFQFHVLQIYSSLQQQAYVLPLTFEEFPQSKNVFDYVFSMGVLYHRKDAINHLQQLYSMLAENGELVLETLIIDSDDADVLIPKERYANMRNVWAVPSIAMLKTWLYEVGFSTINVVDVTMTTTDEQRQTEWMTRYSLTQALDPKNPNLTIEGYPAPLRASLIAEKK